MSKKDKKFIFGLGVPRSGSTSLSKYLSAQDDVRVRHELYGHKISWKLDYQMALKMITRLNIYPEKYVGSTHFAQLNYVKFLYSKLKGNVVFPVMKRDFKSFFQSHKKKTRGRNRFKTAGKWSNSYPYYDIDNLRDCYLKFYNEYYNKVDYLINLFGDEVVKVFNIEDLNTVDTFSRITDFCEIELINKDIIGTIFNKGSK